MANKYRFSYLYSLLAIILFVFPGKANAQCPVVPAFTFVKSCTEDYRISFTNNSTVIPPGQIDYYQWHFGDATTSTATNPWHTYPAGGTYQVILFVYDTSGCYDSIIQNVLTTALPQASFTYSQTGCGEITFTNTSTYSGSNPAWFWAFGDGQISTLQDPVHTYISGGIKNVSLTVTDEYGCSNSYFFSIAVFPPATVDFTYDQTNCETVQFFDNSTGTGVITRLWDFGDGFTSTATNPMHTYVLGATYVVTLTISDQYCSGLVHTDTLVFPNLPTASFTSSPDGQCATTPIDFDASGSIGTNLNYSWDYGDGTSVSGLFLPASSHTYNSYNNATCDLTQSYTVQLMVTDGIGCTDTVTDVVTTQRIPHPLLQDLSGNNFQNCYSVNPADPTDTLWVDNLTPNMACIISIDISWGDGNDTLGLTAADFPLSHIYMTLGEFPLTITAYGINGCNSDTTYVVANQVNPSVGISGVGSNSGCAPHTARFILHGYTVNSLGTSYIWDFDDGTIVNWNYNQPYINDTIDHVYTQSHCANPLASSLNGYIPSVTAVNACGSWTSTIQYITIFETPIADFTSVDTSNYGCFDVPFCFLNYTYHGFSTDCDSSVNYTWDFGDGNTSNQAEPCHTYAYPGTYQVNLLADNPLCGGSDTTIAIHITGTHADFTFDTACVNNETHFTHLSWAYDDSTFQNNPGIALIGFYWDFGDGGTSTLQNPNHIFPDTGIFVVSLTVTNEYGCDSTITKDVYIDGIFIDSVIVDSITCHNTNDGSITVNIAGGIPIITYTLNPGSITNTGGTFNGLGPGSYWIFAEDAMGCWAETDTIQLDNPDLIIIDSVWFTNITCNNDNDGTITTFASGGTNPLTYTLIPPGISNATGLFTGLAGGTYRVVVDDANGCPADTSGPITITNPPPVIIDSVQSIDISCHNADDGYIQVWAQGGTGTLTYTLNPSGTSNITGIFSFLSGGSYYVVVTDDNGCADTTAGINIINPTAITITNVTSTDMSCHDTLDGSITVIASGGTGLLTYTLLPTVYINSSGIFTGLGAGTYYVRIEDENGCADSTFNIIIDNPGEILITNENLTQITCHNASDGIIEVIAGGGNLPYVYTLLPPNIQNGTGQFNGLAPGTYYVIVEDANGCPSDTSNLFTLVNPPLLLIDSVQSMDISCQNYNDGWIQVWASGGTGTLTYTLNPAAISNITGLFINLAGGTYSVTITDNNGCNVTTANIDIINPSSVQITGFTYTDMSCHDTIDGSITVTAAGGTGIPNYTLEPLGITNISGIFTGLGSGAYYVRVEDGNGCMDSTASIIIINPGEILITTESVTQITCFNADDGIIEIIAGGGNLPYIYTLFPPNIQNATGQFNGLAPGTYYVIVEDANGCPSDTSNLFTLANPPELIIDSLQNQDISCHDYDDGWIQVWTSGGTGFLIYTLNPLGITNNTGLFNNLAANTYTVTVEDSNNCLVSTPGILIVNPPGITVNVSYTDVTCYGYNDGSISISASGGVGLLDYSIDNGFSYFPFSVFTNLSPGNYIARVRDANACETTGIPVVISEPALLQITGFTIVTPTCSGCSDGQITANVSGGTMPYSHSWSNGMSGNPITGLPSGWYTDTLTDANGCQVIDSVFMDEPGPLNLTLDSSNVICYGDNTGWVAAIVSGGTTPYTYEWTKLPAPAIIGTNDTLFNCDAGFYALTAYDFFNNLVQDTIEVGQADTLALTLTFADTVCFGATNGWASVTAVGGIPPYTYLWSGGAGANTDSIYNLAAGIYTITVTDQNGCQTIDNVTIQENPELLVVATTSDPLICSGFSVQLNAAPSGGTFPVTSYQWTPVTGLSDPFIQSPVATPSTTITYTVLIIDQRACIALDSVTVTVVPSPTADFIYQNPCASNVVNFLNLSNPNGDTLVSYNWDFGDGYFSSLQHPTHTYGTVDTTYTVTLIVQNANGCTDTIVQGVYVNPMLGLIVVADTVCIGSPTHFNDTVTNPSAVIIGYFYDFGDGYTDTVPDPVHQYALPGLYNVSVSVEDTSACVEATSFAVRVHALPFPDFMDSTSCINDITYFTDLTDTTAAGINSWFWDFGDGNTSSQQHPAHLYTIASTYQVTLSIENANGCIDSISKPVVVFSGPDAEFQTDTVCLGTPSHFIDLSTASSGVINSWLWNFGDGNTSTQQYPIHYYSSPGFYYVVLIIGSTTGCTDTVMHVAGVNELPFANFTYDTPCEFGQTTFTDLSVANAASLTIWYWDFGDGYTSNLQNPQHVFPAEGDYIVNLTVINSNGCSDDTSMLVTVLPSPTADFTAASSCFNSATHFMDLSYGPVPIMSWDWDFGDGNTSTVQNPVHTYAAPGTYSVSLMVFDTNGCSSTISKSHTVYEGPEADFSADAVCLGEATVFDDLSISNGLPIIGWHWDFGDGNTSVLQHPVHVYIIPGTYSVTLTVTDLGACEDSITINVEVNETPTAMFSADAVCVDHETSFTDLSMPAANIVSWFWNFGDPASGMANYSYLQNPVHTYTLEGAYSVSLTATILGGCTHTTVQEILVEPPPFANFTFTNEHCVGEAVLFIDLSQTVLEIIDMWVWDFGDGTRDTIYHPANPNIEHTFMNPGQHLVTLTVRNIDGCFGSTSRPINILPVPIAAFDHSTSCEDMIVHFTDMTNQNGGGQVINWWWDFGDPLSGATNNSQLQNPDHIFSGSGLYDVTLIAWNANSCRDTVIQIVDVQPKPPIDFYADAACEGELTQFYVNDTVVNVNTITSYLWDFGDGMFSNLQNPQHLFAVWGTYDVTLTITDTSLCENSMTKEITVDQLPLAFFDITEPTCNGDSVFFNDLSSTTWGYIQTWVWDFDDGSPLDSIIFPDDPNVYHTYIDPGTYGATLTVTNSQGCSHSFMREVDILATPIANFHTSANPCQNEEVQFTDASFPNGQGNILSWYWEFDDPISGINNTSTLQNPVHIFSQGGIVYDVLLIVVNFNNCTDTIVKPVFVNESPDVAFFWEGACEDTLTYFFPDSSIMNIPMVTSWLWEFGDGQYSTEPTPAHNYENSGYYNVTLTVQDTGVCTSSRTKEIFISEKPNAFFDVSEITCMNSPVYFDDLSFVANSYIIEWYWHFGDGNDTTIYFPDEPDIEHNYEMDGTYLVTLMVTSADSCYDFESQYVVIDAAPIALFNYDSGCFGIPTPFWDNSSGGGGLIINSWYWDFGDPQSGVNNTSTSQDPEHLFSGPGVYDVLLTVTNAGACVDTIVQQVTVNEGAPVDFYSLDTCLGLSTHFYIDETLTDTTAIIVYDWDFGDGSPHSSQMNPVHMYDFAGIYDVILTIYDTSGCSNAVMHEAEVLDNPIALFEYDAACASDTAYFTDLSYTLNGDLIVAWDWDFGDPASGTNNYSNLQHPIHVFTGLENYDVTLIVTNDRGCQDSIMIPLAVSANPVSNFTYYVNPCQAGLVYFSDSSVSSQSPIIEWEWYMEPGSYSYIPDPYHIFLHTDTTYYVSLTVINANGCTDKIIKAIYIPIGMEVELNNSQTCHLEAMQFSATILQPLNDSIYSYSWNFGEPQSGPYNTSILPEPEHTYMNPGYYTVSLTAVDMHACETTIFKQILVENLPEPAFEWETLLCDSTIYFTDLSSGNGTDIISWLWDFGDETALQHIELPPGHTDHFYMHEGSYTVTLTVTNANGCVQIDTMVVLREPCLTSDFFVVNNPVCERNTIFFADSSTVDFLIEQWYWDFGDGSDTLYHIKSDQISHYYENAGEYDISLVVSAMFNSVIVADTFVKAVTVRPTPQPAFVCDPVCLGNSSVFVDATNFQGSYIASWQWSFGTGLPGDTSDYRNPVFKYDSTGSHNVSLITVNQFGCLDSVTQQAFINHLPIADYEYTAVCEGDRVWFTDLSDGYDANIVSWQWDFNDPFLGGDTSSMQNPVWIYEQLGTNPVSLIVRNENGCVDTVVYDVKVNSAPMAGFELFANFDNMQGSILLEDQSEDAIEYHWDFGDGYEIWDNYPPISHIYDEEGSYVVSLAVWNEFGCPDSTFIDFEFMFKTLFIPNALAPAGNDPEVKVFQPKGRNIQEFYIAIHDSWGNLLWESSKLDSEGRPAESWDGTYDGKLLPTDVYIWRARAVFRDGTFWEGNAVGNNEGGSGTTHGTVTLVR